MQLACFDHFAKLFLNLADLLVQHPAVTFDLCLTRTTDKAQTTALAFQVGP